MYSNKTNRNSDLTPFKTQVITEFTYTDDSELCTQAYNYLKTLNQFDGVRGY